MLVFSQQVAANEPSRIPNLLLVESLYGFWEVLGMPVQ